MDEIERISINTGFVRDSLTESEIAKLLHAFDESVSDPSMRKIAYRNYAITMLWAAVGLRGIEPARAKRCDLKIMEGHHALVFQGKRQDAVDNLVIVKEWALNPMNEYFALHDRWHTPDPKWHKRRIHAVPSPVLLGQRTWILSVDEGGPHEAWLSADRSLGHPTDDAALFGKSELTHAEGPRDWPVPTNHPPFPYSAATIALKQGAPLDKVQPMLRHASIGTTMLYVHSDEERITEAAEHRISDFTKPY